MGRSEGGKNIKERPPFPSSGDLSKYTTEVTAQMDPGLNEHKFIVPGLGDFGDRYYNTGDFCNSEWVKSPLLDIPKL